MEYTLEQLTEVSQRLSITLVSLDVFIAYAKDAPNWSGTPLIGCNVGGSKAERGNITQLKKAELITTSEEHEKGQPTCFWIHFTEKGRALAAELNIRLQ